MPVKWTPEAGIKGFTSRQTSVETTSNACIDCGSVTSQVNSQKAKMLTGWGKKEVPHPTLHNPDGSPVMITQMFPMFKHGRICDICFECLDIRVIPVYEKRNGDRIQVGTRSAWFSRENEVIILWESNHTTSTIPGSTEDLPNEKPKFKERPGKWVMIDKIMMLIPDRTNKDVDPNSYLKFMTKGKRGDYR